MLASQVAQIRRAAPPPLPGFVPPGAPATGCSQATPLPCTSTSLRARLGDPKEDIQILGRTVWRRSCAYKAVLARLDEYHGSLTATLSPGSTAERTSGTALRERAARSLHHLGNLESALQAYLATHRMVCRRADHPRRRPLHALMGQIRTNQAALQMLTRRPLASQTTPNLVVLGNARLVDLLPCLNTRQTVRLSLAAMNARFLEAQQPQRAASYRRRGIPEAQASRLDARYLAYRLEGNSEAQATTAMQTVLRWERFFQKYRKHSFPHKDIVTLWKHREAGCSKEESERLLLEAKRKSHRLKPLSATERTVLEKAGFATAHAQAEARWLYRDARVPILPRTLPQGRLAEQQKGPMRRLGVGGFSATFSVSYWNEGCTQADDFVFKAVPQEECGYSDATGVYPFEPKTAERNLATSDVARLLGFPVVGPIQMAVGLVPTSAGEPTPTLGLLMEKAGGRTASDAIRHDRGLLRDGDLIAQVTQLQLLDSLCGQTDRHHGNFCIDRSATTGAVAVRAFDHDQSFGHLIRDPRQFTWKADDPLRQNLRLAELPLRMDTDMARAIEGLEDSVLRDTLARCGLGALEIDAACARLQVLKAHVVHLRAGNKIIRPDQWTDASVLSAMVTKDTYFARLCRLRS